MGSLIIAATVFVAIGSLFLMAILLFSGDKGIQKRKEQDGSAAYSKREMATSSRKTKPKSKNKPTSEELMQRIVQAGFYRKSTIVTYQTIRYAVPLVPLLVGLMVWQYGWVSPAVVLVSAVISGAMGMVLPSFWLDIRRNNRQMALRRSMPDALDVIIICVEAGLSLPAALTRVSGELSGVHPLLAAELSICQREIQMGCSTGESLMRLAKRFDSAEVRGLASVITQAEKYGASIVNALKVHAESMRVQRFQQAEERAAKAAVKLVFPTILFIFPALFIVLAGPAVIRIFSMFDQMGV